MSVEKYGAVKNLLDGFVYSEYNARANQGVAIFPELMREVLTRADLEGDARVTAPRVNGTTDIDVDTGAVRLAGVLADNSGGSASWVQLFATNTPTLGTTDPVVEVQVPAGRAVAVVLAEPASMAALTWDATTAAKGSSRSTAGTVKVSLVYVK